MFKIINMKGMCDPMSAFMVVSLAGVITSAVLLTPSFRVKKAQAKCDELGYTAQQCAEEIETIKTGDITFIRDI